MEIVFATNNNHKLEEVRAILESVKVLSLSDIGFHADIPETGTTLDDNALQKAEYIWNEYHIPVFADDTGLEVDALNGAPGVYSARYAGDNHDSDANITKLLKELKGQVNRTARFRTVVALIMSDAERQLFSGIVTGKIIDERRGAHGFGYDPIFIPSGYDNTFAEMDADVKNAISHRSRAIKKLADYLKRTI